METFLPKVLSNIGKPYDDQLEYQPSINRIRIIRITISCYTPANTGIELAYCQAMTRAPGGDFVECGIMGHECITNPNPGLRQSQSFTFFVPANYDWNLIRMTSANGEVLFSAVYDEIII